VQHALDTGAAVAAGAVLTRDLVNEPGGTLTPPVLAERLDALASEHDLECTVWDEQAIRREGLGGLLGVNRGSTLPPRFVQLRYAPPAAPRGRLALVGKGITFDSGGLSIKTGAGMMTMKDDMGGAAAVAGAMSVLRVTAPKCEVRAYLPLTDNMSDGDATRPGDVLRIRGGKTVEVLNTDAEGRLVLADALTLATEADPAPDAVLDLATLTGAVESALGQRIAGLMGNHEGWIDEVRAAAGRAGERVWPLPLPADYRRHLDSDVADLRNIGRIPAGGSLIAGIFLQEFVGNGIPWAHLDIAGTAWSTEVDGELAKGATGFGVRLLVELAGRFRKPR
jgi:leucyl aminopeptidase